MKTASSNPCPAEPPKINVTDLTQVYITPTDTIHPPTGFPEQPTIFVGGMEAVNLKTLQDNKIIGVLNVSYDCDDLPPTSYFHQFNPNYQLAKVGLIDGTGNYLSTIVAAVLMADQLFNFPPVPPVKPALVNTYKCWMRGNLLIHCWDGGSRSITITALYLYYKFGLYYKQENLNTFEKAYSYVIGKRAPYAPNNLTQGMCTIANELVSTYAELFPAPKLK